jgi:hypothetical protein
VEEPGSQTLSFVCDGLRQGPFEDPAPEPSKSTKRPRPRWDVEFRWNSIAGEQRLKARVHVQREDLSRPRLCFFEGDFAATLLVDGENGKPAKCELELSLAGVSTRSALRTLDLLDAMRDRSRGAMVHAENEGVVVQLWRRTVDIVVPRGQVPGLEGIALDARGPLSIPCWESLSIGGVELDVGNVWLELPDARLVERTQVERDGAHMERLRFGRRSAFVSVRAMACRRQPGSVVSHGSRDIAASAGRAVRGACSSGD